MKIYTIVCFVLYLTQVVFSLTEEQEHCVGDLREDFSKRQIYGEIDHRYTIKWYAQYAFLYIRRDTGEINFDYLIYGEDGASSSNAPAPYVYEPALYGVLNCGTFYGSSYYIEILKYITVGGEVMNPSQYCGFGKTLDQQADCIQHVTKYFHDIPAAEIEISEMHTRIIKTYENLTYHEISFGDAYAREYLQYLSSKIELRTREVSENDVFTPTLQTEEVFCIMKVPIQPRPRSRNQNSSSLPDDLPNDLYRC